MKSMKHWKLATAGLLGLILTANASAQSTIVRPVFEKASASYFLQDLAVPAVDPVIAPAQMNTFQQDCFGGMQSMGGMEYAMQSDIVDSDAAHVTITVPENAKIFANGDPTASKGPVRHFVVRHLEPGQQYKFVFRAEMENAAGVKIEEKKELMLKLGDSHSFSLTPWQKVIEEAVIVVAVPVK